MMMRTLVISLLPIFNVLLLWAVLTFVYGVIGVSVFSNAIQGANLQKRATFETLGGACYVLFRIATGESWEAVMYDLFNPPNNLK